MIRSSVRRRGISTLQTVMILAVAVLILLAVKDTSGTAVSSASTGVDDLASSTTENSSSDFARPVPAGDTTGETKAETWSRLASGEDYTQTKAVRDALSSAKSTIQKGGYGSYNYDEYKFTIDTMPQGLTPDQLLNEFAKNPNQLVGDGGFDAFAKFHPRFNNRDAVIGHIFDIDIPGNSGSVMVVNKTKTYFDVATLTTPGDVTGSHPVSGTRSFGYQMNPDKSITFYTRGRDIDATILGDNNGIRISSQAILWARAMKGLSNKINDLKGGKSRPGSFENDLQLTDGSVPTPKTSQ